MRPILGGVAALLGVVALVLGFRADSIYDRLAVVPLDQQTTAVSEGTGVQVMRVWNNKGKLRFDALTDQHVRNTRVVRGIPGEVPADKRGDEAFWQLGLKTEIVDVAPITMSVDGVSIDRRTAMSTNCCGDTVSAGTLDNPTLTKPTRHEGLFFKFPFDAQKQSYPFWDAKLGSARDAVYTRTEQVQGVETYVYEQQIDKTRLPGSQSVPRTLFGSGTGNVTASSDYANTRTFWVEPHTGIIIRAQEDIDQSLVSSAGTVTMVKGVIGYTDATQRALADEYRPKAAALSFVRDRLQLLGFVIGTLLLVVGLAVLFWARRHRDDEAFGRLERTEPPEEQLEYEEEYGSDAETADLGHGAPRGARAPRTHDEVTAGQESGSRRLCPRPPAGRSPGGDRSPDRVDRRPRSAGGRRQDAGMRQIEVSSLPPSRLASLIGQARWESFERAADAARHLLGGRIVWNVNATAQGGGVAEMLQILLAYGQGAGMDTRWLVLDGRPQFFATTKRLHNLLHGSPGDGGPLGEAERADYEEVLAANLETTEGVIRPGDFVILHDPQTAGLIPGLRERGARPVWRSHIGRDHPNACTERGWAFLAPYLEAVEGVIVSRAAYAPPSVPLDRVTVIAPSIDPFATKNEELDDALIVDTLVRVRLLEGLDDQRALLFGRRDGGVGEVQPRSGLLVAGDVLPRDARILLQVSRWDRLKDMTGVMHAFADHLRPLPPDAHLVLCGPAVEGVSDDPEGAQVLAECRQAWEDLPGRVRERVHLVCVPMDDVDENAHIVNALQRHSYAVVQKSLFEGFGLTVTEAMWKHKPVIASAVGGIQDQITDGVDGLLIAEPTDLAATGSAMGHLLADPEDAARLGDAAHARVLEHYLGDRHLTQYSHILEASRG